MLSVPVHGNFLYWNRVLILPDDILWGLSDKITAVTVKVGKSYRVQVSTLCLVLADNAIDLHGQE